MIVRISGPENRAGDLAEKWHDGTAGRICRLSPPFVFGGIACETENVSGHYFGLPPCGSCEGCAPIFSEDWLSDARIGDKSVAT